MNMEELASPGCQLFGNIEMLQFIHESGRLITVPGQVYKQKCIHGTY